MPYAVPLINKFSYKKMRKSAGNHFFQANIKNFVRISKDAEQARYDIKKRKIKKSAIIHIVICEK